MYILNTGKKYKYREEIFIPIPHQHIKIRKMPAWNADTMKNQTAPDRRPITFDRL